MKARKIRAHKNSPALPERSEVELRGGALIEPSDVTRRDGRVRIVARHDDGLRAHKRFAGVNLFVFAFAVAAVDVRFRLNQELEPGQHSQFSDLINADASTEFRRGHGTKAARFELQITHGR